jgi:hypothetical protein
LSQVSTVDWRVSPESGISVADFISGQNALAQASGLPSGTLSFAENEFSKTITIQIAQDSIKEDDETLTVELFNPSSGTSIASANASGEIRNDDTLIGFVHIQIAALWQYSWGGYGQLDTGQHHHCGW